MTVERRSNELASRSNRRETYKVEGASIDDYGKTTGH
jgi:hypothetical protein